MIMSMCSGESAAVTRTLCVYVAMTNLWYPPCSGQLRASGHPQGARNQLPSLKTLCV
uniref:Uridine kinase n=1 Tax=Rhizophora mucronata TaxID=61149 RepID=A0A2P2MG11_RHIMU